MNQYIRLSNNQSHPGHKKNPIIMWQRTNEVKGSWIKTQCIICFSPMVYWSKKAIPLTRYKFPRCEVHK